MYSTSRILARLVVCALIAGASARAGSPYTEALSAGLQAVRAGEPATAASYFTRAVRANPNHPAGWNAWGLLLLGAGDTEKARAAFLRAKSLEPNDARAAAGSWLADALDGKRNAESLDRLCGAGVSGASPIRAYLAALEGGTPPEPTSADHPLDTAVAAYRGEGSWEAVLAKPLPANRPVFVATFDPAHPITRGWSSRHDLTMPALAPTRAISGPVVIKADDAAGVESAAFLVNDTTVNVTNRIPPVWYWDTPEWPNGVYVVSSVCRLQNGRTTSRTEVVRLANEGAPKPPHPEGIEEIERAMDAILEPQPDVRYATFMLARQQEQAGDLPAARALLWRIVSVSPDYAGVIEALERMAPQSRPAAVHRGPSRGKRIALTFDDGPVPHRTPALLDLLREIGVPATFFVVGRQATAHPDIVRRMQAEGHEVANHTWSHRNLARLSRVEVLRELSAAREAVRGITGTACDYFRPPGGNINEGVSSAAALLGMTPVMWTYNAGVTEGMPVEEMVPRYVKAAKPGAIYLVHNGTDKIVQALPQVVTELRKQGYEFVTLSELLEGAP
jgi:peptidoglycan/xylan/chitin deacetylase (PgdA/CDA1 family)